MQIIQSSPSVLHTGFWSLHISNDHSGPVCPILRTPHQMPMHSNTRVRRVCESHGLRKPSGARRKSDEAFGSVSNAHFQNLSAGSAILKRHAKDDSRRSCFRFGQMNSCRRSVLSCGTSAEERQTVTRSPRRAIKIRWATPSDTQTDTHLKDCCTIRRVFSLVSKALGGAFTNMANTYAQVICSELSLGTVNGPPCCREVRQVCARHIEALLAHLACLHRDRAEVVGDLRVAHSLPLCTTRCRVTLFECSRMTQKRLHVHVPTAQSVSQHKVSQFQVCWDMHECRCLEDSQTRPYRRVDLVVEIRLAIDLPLALLGVCRLRDGILQGLVWHFAIGCRAFRVLTCSDPCQALVSRNALSKVPSEYPPVRQQSLCGRHALPECC